MSKYKSFYTDKDAYNADALTLLTEADNTLRPLFQKWIDEGYSPVEISHLIMHSALSNEVYKRLQLRRSAKEV